MSTLRQLSPDDVSPNPENPRLVFREAEMDLLLESIHRNGIQVPLTVYEDGQKFVLIDGERRWRCAQKLNLKKIPALVQAKPSELQNLLLMYNIHALREQWDYLTIALKLPRVILLYKKEHREEPTEARLAELTGLTRSQVRRCRLILGLPVKYRDELLEELRLPSHKQKLSEDFLLEMEKALRAVEREFPEALSDTDKARDAIIYKYRSDIIKSPLELRELKKLVTSGTSLGWSKQSIVRTIRDIADRNNPAGIAGTAETLALRLDEQRFTRAIALLNEFFTDTPEPRLSATARKQALEVAELIISKLRSK